jgi:hypothetical protein
MTDLPDDEPQPGSRAWMEQTAQLDSAMATARRYLSPSTPRITRPATRFWWSWRATA